MKDEELWNEIFAEVDTDGDGEMSFEEFKLCMHKVITSTNKEKYLMHSGTVDPQEIVRLNNQTKVN